jgi:hypothetical protein
MDGAPLAKAEDLAALLGVPVDDPQLLQALTLASNRFRAAVRHYVSAETARQVVLDGTGGVALRLPSLQVQPASVVCVIDGTPVDVEVSIDGVIRRMDGYGFPDSLGAIGVTYDAGYPDDAIPLDVQAAVLEQARAGFNASPGVTAMTVGAVSYQYDTTSVVGTTQFWSDTVEAYRIRVGDRS